MRKGITLNPLNPSNFWCTSNEIFLPHETEVTIIGQTIFFFSSKHENKLNKEYYCKIKNKKNNLCVNMNSANKLRFP